MAEVSRNILDLYLAYRQAKYAAFMERRGTGLLEFAVYEQDLGINLRRLLATLKGSNAWFDAIPVGRVCAVPKRMADARPRSGIVSIGAARPGPPRDVDIRMQLIPSVDFLIAEVLFLWKYGPQLESALSADSIGNRLETSDGIVHPTQHRLFEYYQPQYQKYRDDPTHAARDLLDENDGRCLIASLDLSGYYDSIDSQFLEQETFTSSVTWRSVDDKTTYLSAVKSLRRAYSRYHRLVSAAVGYKVSRGIPIGSLTSRLVANLTLATLDRYVRNCDGVTCYRRYVDDIFIVGTPFANANADVVDVLRRWLPIKVPAAITGDLFFLNEGELHRTGCEFKLQSSKLGLYELEGAQGRDYLDAVVSDTKRIASERQALLDTHKLEPDMLTSIVRDGRTSHQGVRVLREADRATLANLESAISLHMLEDVAHAIDRSESPGVIRRALSQLVSVLLVSADWVEHAELYQRLLKITLLAGDWTSAKSLLDRSKECYGTSDILNAAIGALRWNSKIVRRATGIEALKSYLHQRRLESVLCAIPTDLSTEHDAVSITYLEETWDLKRIVDGAFLFSSADLRMLDREDDHNYRPSFPANPHRLLERALRRFPEMSARLKDIDQFLQICSSLNDESWRCTAVALFASTRPPQYFDVSRRFFAEEELKDRRPGEFLQVQSLVNSLRGTRYYKPVGGLKGKDEVVLDLFSRRIPISESRLILGNLFTPLDSWKRSFQPQPDSSVIRPDTSLQRYEGISTILLKALDASRAGPSPRPPSLLVLPELSVPRRWIRLVAKHIAKMESYSVVMGVEYFVERKKRQVRNQAMGIFIGDFGVAATCLWTKQFPAEEEARGLAKAKPAFSLVSTTRSRPRTVLDTPFGRISVLICSELIEARLVHELVGRTEIVLVPSWNPDTSSYEHLVQSVGLQMHGVVAIANNAEYSDCRAWAPARVRYERDMGRLIERNVNEVLVVDVPIAKLRQFHSGGLKDGWKPLPPGWRR
jgi:predicted amidohydrolase